MPQTYTSPTLSVSNGEITNHDTATVASDINILAAECRWQGVDAEKSEPNDGFNSNSASGTTAVSKIGDNVSLTFPGYNGSFDGHVMQLEVSSGTSQNTFPIEFTIRFNYEFTGFDTVDHEEQVTIEDNTTTSFPQDALSNEHVGSEIRIGVSGNTDAFVEWTLAAITKYTTTTTITKSTQDPFVTRDVDGSFSGTLSDGEWSSWKTLNGLATGVNEFYHNISGSNEAKFEFRYDWEYTYPEPVGGALSIGSRDGSQVHRVALADPSSSRLAYNHVRALVGGTVYAIDVVDPSDPDAIDWLRIGSQHGVVCPRAYQTESA